MDLLAFFRMLTSSDAVVCRATDKDLFAFFRMLPSSDATVLIFDLSSKEQPFKKANGIFSESRINVL